MSFEKLTVTDLNSTAVVAQSLDNQWVPPALLTRLSTKGWAVPQIRDQLRDAVRADYIRALVNSPQIVVNRAFLYNNPIVFEDFKIGAPHRDAFLGLLSSGAIVQMLVIEKTPVDTPGLLEDKSAPDYTIIEEGWAAWTAAAEESHVHSLRFSWEDDAANGSVVRQRLAEAFAKKAQTLTTLHTPTLATDLGVGIDHARSLMERLLEVSHRCAEITSKDGIVTRELLYKDFITANGSSPSLGQYDWKRPHVTQVKQLIDLVYNVNLAVGLETLAMTPADAMHRAALQEWQSIPRGRTPLSPEQLAGLVRGVAFEFIQNSLFIDTFGKISMRDVSDVRRTQPWSEYTTLMAKLLEDPLSRFEDPAVGAGAVMRSYVGVLGEVTRIATSRDGHHGPERWARDLAVVMTVELTGAIMEIEFMPEGPVAKLCGALATPMVAEAAMVSIRMGLRGLGAHRGRRHAQSALDTQTQVINSWVESAGGFWTGFVREIEALTGAELDHTPLLRTEASADGDPDLPAALAGALD